MPEPKSRSKNISKNNVIESSGSIEPVDPNLELPGDIRQSNNNKIISKSKLESFNIKKRLSIEIINEILRNPTITTEEREKLNSLIEKIEGKNYFYCYGDLNGPHSDIIRFFEQSEKIIEKPILIELPDMLNYDVELYKIGKTCSGLKKRNAIIKRGGFFSSKKPLKDLNDNNKITLKDKTQYLCGSNVYIETKNDLNRNQGEWSNKSKNYRIRIDYSLGPTGNNKSSSFFLYFNDENQMKEVEQMLFHFILKDTDKKKIKNNLVEFENILTKGNKFYTIIKILSLKNKIKLRKKAFDKVNSSINKQIFAELSIERKYLRQMSIRRQETIRNTMKEMRKKIIVNEPPIEKPKPIIVKENKPPKKINICEKQYSDFIPIISNISSECGFISFEERNQNVKSKNCKKSLNNLINKYSQLKEEIPDNIIDKNGELSEEGMCFNIQNGIKIQKNAILNNNEENNNFNLEPELCNNAKYIYIDKNKPEIKFKADNNNDDENNSNEYDINNENNKLSDINIYEISNIILNTNNDLNGKEENNLVILGPKIDNKKGINYKYNKNTNNSYTDPENYKIKSPTINLINKEDIKGTNIQIYQSELDINNPKIHYLLQNITGSIIPEINTDNLKDNLLFSYRIRLSEIKYIDSLYTSPEDYKNNICFIEYNHQYFIPEDYFNKNNKLIIECFCVPVVSYSGKEKDLEEKIGYFGKLLSPVKIGYVEVNYDDINNGKYKYEIKKDGIPEPNSFLILDGGPGMKNNIDIKNIEGKDYSIGDESYLQKIINKDFIEKARDNSKIPDDIKNKYFNICFDSETEENFLFRPCEEMDENEFIRDISNYISNEDLQKIKNNKKYNYLPYCEKYKDPETLFKSQNLKCLTDEQKNDIINNYQPDQWIYKMPEIKVKLLSKNLGITKYNNLLSQLLYSTEDEENIPIQSLDKDSKNDNILMPISENNFNIFDMKEMSQTENLENYQWKTGIKFKNTLQMECFKKLLILSRQNINNKKKIENIGNNNNFDSSKIIEFEYNKKNISGIYDNPNKLGSRRQSDKCEINIEFIDFRQDFQLEKDPTLLEVIVFIENQGQAPVENTILNSLVNKNYNFENSLLKNDEKIKSLYNKNSGGKISKKEYFPKKVKLSKKKFNKGQKKLILGQHLKTQFDINNNINDNNTSYKLLVILNGNNEYYTFFDIKQIINSQMCNKFELPLYKAGEDVKIYGCIGFDLYAVDNSGLTFKERYEELNNIYLKEPLLILKEQSNLNIQDNKYENYHFGLYEPNVFRRKILNFVHNYEDINVDPTDLENSLHKDLEILYEKLNNKCVILPKKEDFSSFKFYNLKKNYDINQINQNSYRRKLALKLLEIQKHEKFLQIFREKEWNIYLDEINKGEDDLKGIDYYKNIQEKTILLNNKDEANKLHSLIYMGIPSVE